jgi:hypothetical protein
MSCQGFDEKVGTLVFISGDELLDGGRRRSVKREREAQLAPAKENLAKADRRGRTRHARCLQQTRKNAADAAGRLCCCDHNCSFYCRRSNQMGRDHSLCLRTLVRFSFQPLSPDPLSDVKAAVLQLDRVGLPLLQKFNGLAIYRPQICTVQDNSSAFGFCRNECLHHRHVFRGELTANLKDHFPFCLSRDPQHLVPRRNHNLRRLNGN